MLQNHMRIKASIATKPTLNHYLKKSEATGTYSYRRAIPKDVRHKLGKREWNISLKTKSATVAKSKAHKLAAQHTEDIEIVRQYNVVLIRRDMGRDTESIQYQNYLKLQGIHPSQAPSILAPEHVKIDWLSKRDEEVEALEDYQANFWPEEDWTDPEAKLRVPEKYILIQEQINFVQGKDKKLIQHSKPSIRKLFHHYLGHLESKVQKNDRDRKSEVNAATRVMESFVASAVGKNIAKRYWDIPASAVTREQAEQWFNEQLLERKPQTVSREVSILNAIFNKGIVTFSDQDKELGPISPFKGLCAKAEKIYELKKETKQISNGDYRAFSPIELKQFLNLSELLNDEARLIVQIMLVTGCRLRDAMRRLIKEVQLDCDVPFIDFQYNKFGVLTKDSRPRQVPLHHSIIDPLTTYIAKLSDKSADAPLFPNYVQKPSDNVSQIVMKQIKKIPTRDSNLVVHSLRHTLQARFDACDPQVDYRDSAAIFGWRNKNIVGEQSKYIGPDDFKRRMLCINHAFAQEHWLVEYPNA